MARKKKPAPGTNEAFDRLALLFPYGSLRMATDPAGFLNEVCDEIEMLRREAKKAAAIRADIETVAASMKKNLDSCR